MPTITVCPLMWNVMDHVFIMIEHLFLCFIPLQCSMQIKVNFMYSPKRILGALNNNKLVTVRNAAGKMAIIVNVFRGM